MIPAWPRRTGGLLAAFRAEVSGGIGAIFGVSVFAIVGVLALAVDFSFLSLSRGRMQSLADATALASAQELRLASAGSDQIVAFARSFALAQIGADSSLAHATISANVGADRRTVEINIGAEPSPTFAQALGIGSTPVAVRSVARLVGGMPICLIGLSPTDKETIRFDKDAKLSAPGCALYSNSTAKDGIKSSDKAVVTAGFICSAGGQVKHAGGFVPEPLLDCPPVPDPLSARPPPTVAGCDFNNTKITSGTRSLLAGTYCGGLTLTGGAVATLQPGVYIVKDGPLDVGGGASLTGVNVGFYLTGDAATVNFRADSSISLTAPKAGPLASLLFFEDRAAPLNRKHIIDSNNARQLLGTVYLSRGSFTVDANNPVADKSAYTVILARKVEADAGPVLVLNTDYGATDIPVPLGLGPNGGTTRLDK